MQSREARTYGQFVSGMGGQVWMPDTAPVLPERRLLVPEPAVKFDKLTPSVMGLRHGQIAERPPIAILQRVIAYKSYEYGISLTFLAKKHGMKPNPEYATGLAVVTPGLEMAIQGKEYAVAYPKGIREYMERHGAKPQDLEQFNPETLVNADQMDAFIDGFERVPYVGPESMKESSDFRRSGNAPEGYALGFAVGITRDFGLPIDFTGVPYTERQYDAFIDGLSGVEVPREYGSLAGHIFELRAFQLGNKVHEIAQAEPLTKAA